MARKKKIKVHGNEGANPKDEDVDWSKAKRFKKTTPVHAIKMEDDFVVVHDDGDMEGKAGDYLVQGKRGDKYPLAADLMEETHEEMPPLNVEQRRIRDLEVEVEGLQQAAAAHQESARAAVEKQLASEANAKRIAEKHKQMVIEGGLAELEEGESNGE